ncbi:hypothetical protein Cadr_000009905 [Camelus dromedarius]|uniref:Uncharacterized protein n=1 Tax=Camelus dromedarius TaxID=9838 RepID=A0A5N4DW81_CAMDR|nr:hypothetical protein Cadr_000009905 [Camelus dromedarius]
MTKSLEQELRAFSSRTVTKTAETYAANLKDGTGVFPEDLHSESASLQPLEQIGNSQKSLGKTVGRMSTDALTLIYDIPTMAKVMRTPDAPEEWKGAGESRAEEG